MTVQKRARILACFFFIDVNVQHAVLGEAILHVALLITTVDVGSHDVKRKSGKLANLLVCKLAEMAPKFGSKFYCANLRSNLVRLIRSKFG